MDFFFTDKEYDGLSQTKAGHYLKGYDTYKNREHDLNFTTWESAFWEKIKDIPNQTIYPNLVTDNKKLITALNECMQYIKVLEYRVSKLESINNKR